MRYWILLLCVVSCASRPVRIPPPEHPDYGRCAWCAELDGAACELPEGCDRCRAR